MGSRQVSGPWHFWKLPGFSSPILPPAIDTSLTQNEAQMSSGQPYLKPDLVLIWSWGLYGGGLLGFMIYGVHSRQPPYKHSCHSSKKTLLRAPGLNFGIYIHTVLKCIEYGLHEESTMALQHIIFYSRMLIFGFPDLHRPKREFPKTRGSSRSPYRAPGSAPRLRASATASSQELYLPRPLEAVE